MKRLSFILLWAILAFCASGFVVGLIVYGLFLFDHETAAHHVGHNGWILPVLLMPLSFILGLKGKLPGTASAAQKQ
jgi:hypothetical protein